MNIVSMVWVERRRGAVWGRKQAGVDRSTLGEADGMGNTVGEGAHIEYGRIKEILARGEGLLGIVPP